MRLLTMTSKLSSLPLFALCSAVVVTTLALPFGCGSGGSPTNGDAGGVPDADGVTDAGLEADSATTDAPAPNCLVPDAGALLNVCGATCIPATAQCADELAGTIQIGPGRCLVVEPDHSCKGYGTVGCPPGVCN
jgi:hypothetical protein